jgi:hypothetical protein
MRFSGPLCDLYMSLMDWVPAESNSQDGEPEGPLLCSEVPASGLRAEHDRRSPHHHNPLLPVPFKTTPTFTPVSQVGCPLKLDTSSLSCLVAIW